MSKAADAFRTISEVAEDLDVPKHVLRFWEARFPHIKPMKRGGGRRYYRPADLELLRGIRHLLHDQGYTIKGVQKILREQGVEAVKQRPEAETKKAKSDAPKPTTAAGRRGQRTRRRKTAAGARPVDVEATIQAMIAELQACRELLAGKTDEIVARAPPTARARGRR